jgi:hypothetical protein
MGDGTSARDAPLPRMGAEVERGLEAQALTWPGASRDASLVENDPIRRPCNPTVSYSGQLSQASGWPLEASSLSSIPRPPAGDQAQQRLKLRTFDAAPATDDEFIQVVSLRMVPRPRPGLRARRLAAVPRETTVTPRTEISVPRVSKPHVAKLLTEPAGRTANTTPQELERPHHGYPPQSDSKQLS